MVQQFPDTRAGRQRAALPVAPALLPRLPYVPVGLYGQERDHVRRPHPLPQDWTQDLAKRQRAGVPPEVEFATKPQIALEQLHQARATGGPDGLCWPMSATVMTPRFGKAPRRWDWRIAPPANRRHYSPLMRCHHLRRLVCCGPSKEALQWTLSSNRIVSLITRKQVRTRDKGCPGNAASHSTSSL